MRRWTQVAEHIGATTRTSEKSGLLADYLRTLSTAELPIAVIFLTGRAFAEVDQRATGLGWATMSAAIGELAGVGSDDLAAAYDRHSDLGLALEDVLVQAGHAPGVDESPSLIDVAESFAAIEHTSGAAGKGALFGDLLRRADPQTARGIVKVLSGDLRIGLREGLVEAAIARAFDAPLALVKRAGMLTGDLGRTASLARSGALDSASLTLFHPLKFMLASPAEDAAEIVRRLGPVVWVEDKYDGIRAQLHKRGELVRLYSRDLHDISEGYPEVIDAARVLPWDGILDGELLGYRDGIVMPFVSLQARLGRKRPSAAILRDIPVIYVAFDVLAVDPLGGGPIAPLLDEPLSDRRRKLEELDLPPADSGGRFALSHLSTATSTDALEGAFSAARARRNEGLMVKDPTSAYSPGRRGYGWLKMKKALATLDCVVVGVEVGHGKRHGVLSDYTFAVRDEASDRLVTIGKAYSGLTDAEIAEMTAWFMAHTLSVHGRYRVVEPSVVVEIAFDVILRSKRHRSGFALRFPRIAHLRRDKQAADADTLETVERLFTELQHGSDLLVTAEARSGRAIESRQRPGSASSAGDSRPGRSAGVSRTMGPATDQPGVD